MHPANPEGQGKPSEKATLCPRETVQLTVKYHGAKHMEGTDSAGVLLSIRAKGKAFTSLKGAVLQAMDADGNSTPVALTTFNGEETRSEIFSMMTGKKEGQYSWRIVFPAQELRGTLYGESETAAVYDHAPHQVSLMVWNLPPLAEKGASYHVSVGAKCHGSCCLCGSRIMIADAVGVKAGEATLGAEPVAPFSAMYYADFQLAAPENEGTFTYTVEFLQESVLEGIRWHGSAKSSFTVKVGPKADATVTIHVIHCESRAPLKGHTVRLHPFAKESDENGVSILKVPSGSYRLMVGGQPGNYVRYESALNVGGDMDITVVLQPNPFEETW